jgi:hypothetical protein
MLAGGPEHLPMDENWRPEQRHLYGYWLKKRPRDAALPGRQHIDPLEIPDLLPHLFLIDVEREPLRFQYRVVGTALESGLGGKLTGMMLTEAFADFAGSVLEQQLTAVVKTAKPIYHKGPLLPSIDQGFLWIERLILPLARDGSTVDMLMGVSFVGPRREVQDRD